MCYAAAMHLIVFTTCTAMSLLGGAGMAKRRDDSCATNPRCELGGLCVLGVCMCVVCTYVCCVCICVLRVHMCIVCAFGSYPHVVFYSWRPI